jgi:glutamate N-acetyltransferase/amino-acid N-acetyltransferase
VTWCRDNITSGRARALLVNSGNANAFTGDQGMRDVRWSAGRTAKALACRPAAVLVASTGVIGEPLPVDRIDAVFPRLVRDLGSASWNQAARAITTTDTFPKGAYRRCLIGDTEVTIAGIAKGSGMIAPNMATMLSFVFTDARIPAAVLRSVHRAAVDRSFNCITVDSDTSTSDTAVLAATGQARNAELESTSDRALRNFKQALLEVYVDLATQVVKDGEGARKFITIDVGGATSNTAARKVGLAIAESPLVKTAIAGEDANWGRIVMAVGKSQAQVDQQLLSVSMGGVLIAHRGQRVAGYTESVVDQHLQGSHVQISVNLGLGRGRARVWTCDLTHEYIRINAEYRT